MNEVLVSEFMCGKKQIALVQLNRPEKKNAMNHNLITQLLAVFRNLSSAAHAAVVIEGAGSTFCAGADLDWMKSALNQDLATNQAQANDLFEMLSAAYQLPMPVICKVQGHAMGGALGLLAVADTVIAAKSTQLAFSEVKLGLVPAVIMPFVCAKVASAKVTELLLTGRVFSALEGEQIDLIQRVCGPDELAEQTRSLLEHFRLAAPEAIRKTKQHLRNMRAHNLEKVRNECTGLIANVRISNEAQEGMKSFFQRQTPSWL